MVEEGKITDDVVHNLILSEIKDLKSDIEDVGKNVTGLRKQIFEGNGQKSLVDQIKSNTVVTRVIIWCVGVLYTAVIGGIVGLIFKNV